jgi:hypothetical protein
MRRSFLLKSCCCIQTVVFFLLFNFSLAGANDVDLKPGDTIGPHNWWKAQGMVGGNLLNRIKQGYTIKLKAPKKDGLPKEYFEATEKYSGPVKLGRNGDLVNYVAGLPFPNFSPHEPEAGLKIAWNFYWRWMGDDAKEGGAVERGKVIGLTIEKDGSERRSEFTRHFIRTRGRVTLAPKPAFPGYEHIDWMNLRADEYPRDTSGTTTLEIRYIDPTRQDDLYIYVPNIRRVRRSPPIQRCATLAPTEFNFDDVNSFNGRITDFNFALVGQKKMLANFSQEHMPFRRKTGDYLPLDESWEVREAYVLEITPRESNYCYPKKILYVDQQTYQAFWVLILDAMGNTWKEQFNFYTTVKIADGQEVLSTASPVIINLQNGRSTVLTTAKLFNQGYQPTLFTLATLQQVMRGGSVR